MKKCTWCGKEYPDEASVCALDQQPLTSAAGSGGSRPATPPEAAWVGGAVYEHAAALVRAGKSTDDIHADLRARGLDEPAAAEVVRKVSGVHKALKEAGKRNMLCGAAWCIGGVLVTALSYGAAAHSMGGGSYIVAWGAVIFGAIQFFRGLGQSTRMG